MAKQATKKGTVAFRQPELSGKGWFFVRDFRMQAAIIAVLTIVFNYNTIFNKYALDDDIIMRQNMYVQKGFSGIGEIMSNDAYKSFYASMGIEQQLSGGRYRPLSIVTFAIEQQIFGECLGGEFTDVRDSIMAMNRVNSKDVATYQRLANRRTELEERIKASNLSIAGIRHGFQVFWYILALLIVFYFLHHFIFRENTDIAFLTVLLFLFHPIHSEVIANVKSRDEIFSLLFIGLTFIFFFKYDLERKRNDLIRGCVFFFLALLSKEYAFVMIVLIPAGLMLFHKRKFSEIRASLGAAGAVFLFYFFIRLSILGLATAPVDKSTQDPLNDPYMYAKGSQAFASKVDRLDDYLHLLVFPYRLSADYSYQHFPYSKMFDAGFSLSLITMLGLVALLVYFWRKKHAMAFALLIYLGFFALVSNMLFDIGATMGERLIFHSSLGFVMLVAWGLITGIEKLEKFGSGTRYLALVFVVAVAIPCLSYTWERNANWSSDYTLFTRDVLTNPNSALCNGNAGAQYMDKALTYQGKDSAMLRRYSDSAFTYLSRATKLHTRYVNGFLNLGLCEYHRGHYEEAAQAWYNGATYFRNHPLLGNYASYFSTRMQAAAEKKDYKTAQYWARLAALTNPYKIQGWIDYGGASYMARDFGVAKMAFNEAFRRKPRVFETNEAVAAWRQDSANAQQGFNVMYYCDSTQRMYNKDSSNLQYMLNMANTFAGNPEFFPESKRILTKILASDPANERTKRMLDSVMTLEKKIVLPPSK